jgi:hypothetical protein
LNCIAVQMMYRYVGFHPTLTVEPGNTENASVPLQLF